MRSSASSTLIIAWLTIVDSSIKPGQLASGPVHFLAARARLGQLHRPAGCRSLDARHALETVRDAVAQLVQVVGL